ncbi:Gfo/Idh/MocA family oxidoreductase [Kiritimatiellota bacterium B12222]|nr:Gfo/Idh/MocA family oxidoreductase [Kiritimatiellota bacterium B12222]
MNTPNGPIRFALLGYGRVAPTHKNAIQALEQEAKIVAICDSNPEALKRGTQATEAAGFISLEEMLKSDEIDVVSICTPSGLHAEHGKQVARAGKHVLVEKPMDVSTEAAQSLIDCCKENGVELFCVFQNRLNTTIKLLKSAIDAGRFGKIYAINSTVIWKREQSYYDTAPWRGTKAQDGGAYLNQGIHFVDAMRHLGGEIIDVKPMIATLARDIESEDTGSALFRYESGALGNIFVTMLGRKDEEGSLTILGEKGRVTIGGSAMNKIEIWDFDDQNESQDTLAQNADYHTQSVYGFGHQFYYQQVAAYLNKKGPQPTSGPDGIKSLSLIRKIYGV